MFPVPLATSSSEVSIYRFWNSVLLYHNRPHLVNRRLTGAVTALFLKIDFSNDNIKRLSDIFTRSAILYEVRKLATVSKDSITEEFVRNILETYDKNVVLEHNDIDDFKKSEDGVFVSVRILLPRHHTFQNCVEVAILDKKNKVATFFAATEFDKITLAPPFPYDVDYVAEGNLSICIQDFEDAETASAEWLCDVLFVKLIKWAENYDENCEIQQSLSLVSTESYIKLYHTLKNKYGKKIIDLWTENTDPLKFVYEDIAIATYLISLWQETNPDEKPSFVDLGCGNGLLVYILNAEGFPGCGIDVRKRKMWDQYPSTVNLKIQTITPSASSLFPEADWIIGNHSDELTPWIPIITSRSSYKTNFFLLPCCSYEFNGQKYRRLNTAISVYAEYLMHIQGICNRCGFITKIDKLRIPSTKRTCIVSFGRDYQPSQFKTVDDCIAQLINKSCSVNDSSSDSRSWINNFKARSKTEKVRNCTQLDKTFIANVTKKICCRLLNSKHFISKADGRTWNKGGSVLLPTLVEFIGKEDLKFLKNECGGLQTLVKNHRYIFDITEGMVKLHEPSTVEITNGKYKNKPCWFYKNHPDGCLHSNEICAYKHE